MIDTNFSSKRKEKLSIHIYLEWGNIKKIKKWNIKIIIIYPDK